jgi:hypothetical protein
MDRRTLISGVVGSRVMWPYGVRIQPTLTNQPLQLRRNPEPTRPALPAPEDPPAQSVPTNDRRWPHDDDRITPSEQSAQRREADATGVIQPSRLNASLDVGCELFAEDNLFCPRTDASLRKRGLQNEYSRHPARKETALAFVVS